MNPTGSIQRKLAGVFSIALAIFVLGAAAEVRAQGSKPRPRPRPPGPPKSMKIEEVFTCKNYVIVDIKFRDANGKVTKVTSGTFYYWSNFLKDKRKPQNQRKFEDSEVHQHLGTYTLKLPGVAPSCGSSARISPSGHWQTEPSPLYPRPAS